MPIDLSPDEVLDVHADLAARLKDPSSQTADFYRYFMDDAVTKHPDRGAVMFYPILPRDARNPTAEQGRRLAQTIGAGLLDAPTYQVTAEMVDVMRKVAGNSLNKIEHLDVAELPGPSGFAWLDEAWPTLDVNGKYVYNRAISWDYTTVLSSGTEDETWDPPMVVPCIRLTMWAHADDDIEYDRQPEDSVNEARRLLGDLTPMHTAVIPFEVRFRVGDEEGVKESAESILGVVHLLWMFLGMEIVNTEPRRVGRGARKRAARAIPKHSGEVRVVLLRRIAHITDPEPGHREVDWSCRWVVQGHSRHLESYEGPRHYAGVSLLGTKGQHCMTCGGRTTFVRPYLKGPDGMPLKVSRQLLKLAR